MAVFTKRPAPKAASACPEWVKLFFFTGEGPAEGSPDHAEYVRVRFLEQGALAALWREHGAALLREWIRTRPGTRPPGWWHHEAPGLRAFLPGQGVVPGNGEFFLGTGVPCAFPEDEERDGLVFEGTVKVESEPTFLRRHRLFLPGEEGRIKRSGWAPEVYDFAIPAGDGDDQVA